MITQMIMCLQWYCRTPLSYKSIRATKMLILPCLSTHIQLKKTVKHEEGLYNQTLHWMHSEAVREEIHHDGLIGGIEF